MSPDPDFAWLEEIALREGPPDEVVQVGGVAVVVRRRDVEVCDLTDEEMALIIAAEPPGDDAFR